MHYIAIVQAKERKILRLSLYSLTLDYVFADVHKACEIFEGSFESSINRISMHIVNDSMTLTIDIDPDYLSPYLCDMFTQNFCSRLIRYCKSIQNNLKK